MTGNDVDDGDDDDDDNDGEAGGRGEASIEVFSCFVKKKSIFCEYLCFTSM